MKIHDITFWAFAISSVHAFAPNSPRHQQRLRRGELWESKDDLRDLSKKLNPLLGYWDPLGIADSAFWGWSDERTIGWLRESEIKHGRVAMFAFVGETAAYLFCHDRYLSK